MFMTKDKMKIVPLSCTKFLFNGAVLIFVLNNADSLYFSMRRLVLQLKQILSFILIFNYVVFVARN